jgi:signal transduction histidine kinase
MQDLLLRMKDAAATMLGGIECRIDGPRENLTRKLPLDFRRNVFLMFKEILNNISKHSQATAVEINLSEQQGVWQLTVHDNGAGFDVASATRGNGLKNLRRRTEKINGQIEIKSQPGAGTTIIVSAKIF